MFVKKSMEADYRKVPDLKHIWVNKDGVVKREAYYAYGNYPNPLRNRRFFKEKTIKLSTNNNGYKYFMANPERKLYQVHIAVAKAFPEICGEWFDGCVVDHINTIRDDNRAENLKVGTYKDNSSNPITLSKMRKGCKSCTKEYQHKYYLEHKEKINANKKNWRENNLERYKELKRKWYHRNKSKLKEVF